MIREFKKISRSLLLRSFYLISIPMVLIQIIGIIIFFELHWDLVLKKLSTNITNDINILIKEYDQPNLIPKSILSDLELKITNSENIYNLKDSKNIFLNKRMNQALEKLKYEYVFKVFNSENFLISLYKNNIQFNFLINKDRLETKTIPGFFLWVLFCSIILSLISYFFIKKQIRPLKRLGIITRSFGRGINTPNLRPTGSTEIRELIRDFNYMKNNINDTFNAQKTMLAGISHDLRTPLTRINLLIDEIKNEQIKNEINSNISEMVLMIDHYIDFIKNEKNEELSEIRSELFVTDMLKNYEKVHFLQNQSEIIHIRELQISRAINNIIDNANKFAKNIYVRSYFNNLNWVIEIEDDGPGTELTSDEIVKPFIKGKNNLNKGSGLGLSIVKKIIDLNEGNITFNKSDYGGLKVKLEFIKILK